MPDATGSAEKAAEVTREEGGRDPGTALVTGCSSGIGRATALTFLADDWTVYATARNRDDLTDLSEAGCEIAALDVTDDADVARVVDRVIAEDGRIDCLVNNAGYGQFGPLEELPVEALHRQFDVNVYGPHQLIRAILPHMREQGRGRIVNVSSASGRVSFPGGGAYCGAKFAVEAISDALRGELEEFGIDVVVVEPGPVETEFTDRAETQLDALERTGEYEWFYRIFEDTQAFGGGGPGAVAPEAVADAILQAATCADPQPRYPVGTVASVAGVVRYVPDRIRDRAFGLARRFLSR